MFPRTQPHRFAVGLRRLFPRASFVGCADIPVADATERSADAAPNMLFAAIPGTRCDGADYVHQAIAKGASALLVEQPLANVDVPQCVVPDVRRAFAELCNALAGYPSRQLATVGVTGTNGKTTTTWLVRSILQAAGKACGLLGTIEYSDGIESRPAPLTTPDSKTFSHWLSAMTARSTTHVAMELSSHALEQGRTCGAQLDVAIVTNITQDHFDYHKTFDNYRDAKARILELSRKGGLVVLNADDPGSLSLKSRVNDSHTVITFGLDNPADVSANILEETVQGTRFTLRLAGKEIEVATPLIGRHNVSNCLAAAAAAHRLGASLAQIASGIEALDSVPGRLERIECEQPFEVFVDYAHTDDALRRCVRSLKNLTAGRVICVFGAGGDRDRAKRPLLGKAASEADLVVVTSDNPRSEPPEAIVDDILAGFRGTTKQPFIELDRAAAIRWAVQHAGPGDTVLIAGKGHETEQVVGQQRFPFDDRQVVRGTLKEMQRAVELRREKLTA